MNQVERVLVVGIDNNISMLLMQLLLSKGVKVYVLYNEEKTTIIEELPGLIWVPCNGYCETTLLEVLQQGISKLYYCNDAMNHRMIFSKKKMQQHIDVIKMMVNLCVQMNVSKVLYISDVSPTRLMNNQIVDEMTVFDDQYHVEALLRWKQEAEIELWRGVEEGLSVIIVHPSIILGYEDKNDTLNSYQRLLQQCRMYKDEIDGFVDIRDLVMIMYMLMESDIYNERLIVHAENISYANISSQIQSRMGHLSKRYINLWSFYKEQIYSSYIKYMPIQYSNRKLLQYFSSLSFTPFSETIAYLCEEWKKNSFVR